MTENGAKIIDLQAFKARKSLVGERKNGVQHSFRPVTASASSVSKSGSTPQGGEVDLAQRIERIKASITRINQLMAELRSSSTEKKPTI